MGLFVKIQEMNYFTPPRTGTMSECAEWFQISDANCLVLNEVQHLQKAIVPMLSSPLYLKHHVDYATFH